MNGTMEGAPKLYYIIYSNELNKCKVSIMYYSVFILLKQRMVGVYYVHHSDPGSYTSACWRIY